MLRFIAFSRCGSVTYRAWVSAKEFVGAAALRVVGEGGEGESAGPCAEGRDLVLRRTQVAAGGEQGVVGGLESCGRVEHRKRAAIAGMPAAAVVARALAAVVALLALRLARKMRMWPTSCVRSRVPCADPACSAGAWASKAVRALASLSLRICWLSTLAARWRAATGSGFPGGTCSTTRAKSRAAAKSRPKRASISVRVCQASGRTARAMTRATQGGAAWPAAPAGERCGLRGAGAPTGAARAWSARQSASCSRGLLSAPTTGRVAVEAEVEGTPAMQRGQPPPQGQAGGAPQRGQSKGCVPH